MTSAVWKVLRSPAFVKAARDGYVLAHVIVVTATILVVGVVQLIHMYLRLW